MLSVISIINALQVGAQAAAAGKQLLSEFSGEMSSDDQATLKAALEKHKEENDAFYAEVQAKLAAAEQAG